MERNFGSYLTHGLRAKPDGRLSDLQQAPLHCIDRHLVRREHIERHPGGVAFDPVGILDDVHQP